MFRKNRIASVLVSVLVAITIAVGNVTAVFAADIRQDGAQATANRVGNVYYVDAFDGDDGNTGTSERQAWQTLSKVSQQTFGPGDTILFKRNQTFSGTLKLNGSGTKDYPITVDAYGGGEKPHLTTSLEKEQVITLLDGSHWVIQNLEITAPNGGGIWIDCPNEIVEDIEIRNMTFHDISPDENHDRDATDTAGNGRLAILVGNNRVNADLWVDSYLKDILIADCEFYNMDNGINTQGNCLFESTGKTYPRNENIVVENCSFRDLWGEAVVLSKTRGMVVRNCSMINTAKGWKNAALAAVWYWGCQESVVSNCEIAGQQNVADGMTVDFDDETETSGYEYIYSHDNVRFMRNCYYGSPYYGGDNWVRYCLSVNDNAAGNDNMGGIGATGERRMKFYNNTIYNGSYFTMPGDGQVIKNNIFYMLPGQSVQYRGEDLDISNNCYYSTDGSPVGVYQYINGQLVPFTDEEGRVEADPMFVDVNADTKEGFRLRAGSPCIGAGVVMPDRGPQDLYGTPLTDDMHNIGAYEGTGVVVGDKDTYTVSAESDTPGVTFNGTGTFEEGAAVTVSAVLPQGYTFDRWTDEDGNFLSFNETYAITDLQADVALKLVCVQNTDLTQAPGVTAEAESEFSDGYQADKAIDGTMENDSRWASKTISGKDGATDTWLTIDLGEPKAFSTVGINWASGAVDVSGIDYTIQVSQNKEDWTTVATVTGNDVAFQYRYHDFAESIARYIKIHITKCEPEAPSSIYDVAVYAQRPEQAQRALITANVNDKLYGRVTGGGWYPLGATATLTASPRVGYEFVCWVDADGNEIETNPLQVEVEGTGDKAYTARFRLESEAIQSCEVTARPNNNEYGTVFGAGSFSSGQDVTLTAVAKEGYKFTGWTDTHGSLLSNSERYTVIGLSGNIEVIANFAPYEQPVVYKVYKNTPNNNSVSGGGVYEAGEQVLFVAGAQEGYRFIEWQDAAGKTVGSQPFYEITASGDGGSYTAVFEKIEAYHVVAQANIEAASITGAGDYLPGKSATLRAEAVQGYQFMGWLDQSGNLLGDQLTLTIQNIQSDLNLVAWYRVLPTEDLAYGKSVTVSSTFDDTGVYAGNYITDGPDTMYQDGREKTRWASSTAAGPHWFYVDLGQPTKFDTVSIDWEIAVGNGYTISVSDDASTWTPVCTIDAGEAAGYAGARAVHSFAPVTARYVKLDAPGGVQTLHISLYDFNILSSEHFNVSASVNEPSYGAVIGMGDYVKEDFVQLTAIPNDGYRFVSWTDSDGQILGTDPTYRVMNIREDISVQANFEKVPKTVTSIAVAQAPDKAEYMIGEALSTEGGKLLITYSDGSTQELPITKDMVSGFESAVPGEQELTVQYEGKTATFTVTVKQPVAVVVTGISILQTPDKTGYVVGEALSTEGGRLLVTYSDGSTQELPITTDMVSGFDSAVPGEQELTVLYEGKTATFTVTVKQPVAVVVTGIAIAQAPDKAEYMIGEALSTEGGRLLITYSDGSTQELPITTDMVSGFDSAVPGEQKLTVTYEGKTATFTVVVKEKAAEKPESETEAVKEQKDPASEQQQQSNTGPSTGESASSIPAIVALAALGVLALLVAVKKSSKKSKIDFH